MPKKFTGENSKAVAARVRKTAVKEEQQQKKLKALDDAYWKDDDKHKAKKQQKKDEQERKKQVLAEKKAEVKALLEQEMTSSNKPVKLPPPQKITRAQVSENVTNSTLKKEKEKEKIDTHLSVPLEENINRLIPEGEHAHTVSEAIAILSIKEGEVDKHPEKRMKAAYTAFEERRLKTLKEEQPTLRLSQLKQIIFKEWQKSPENPLNTQ